MFLMDMICGKKVLSAGRTKVPFLSTCHLCFFIQVKDTHIAPLPPLFYLSHGPQLVDILSQFLTYILYVCWQLDLKRRMISLKLLSGMHIILSCPFSCKWCYNTVLTTTYIIYSKSLLSPKLSFYPFCIV